MDIVKSEVNQIVKNRIVNYTIFTNGISLVDTNTKTNVFIEMSAKEKVMLDCAMLELERKLSVLSFEKLQSKAMDFMSDIDSLIETTENKARATKLKLLKNAIGAFICN